MKYLRDAIKLVAKRDPLNESQAVDYCPHCAVDHVIGEHPHEGETAAQYWKRMKSREEEQEEVGGPVKQHEFRSTGAAYNACQTDDNIQTGDTLIIDREQVIGLADAWPVAVTENFGELHTMKEGRPMSGHFPREAIDAAVAEANKRGWPVRKEAR